MPVLVARQTEQGMPGVGLARFLRSTDPYRRVRAGYPGWPDSVYAGPSPASAARAASTRRAV
jgi:hypothetical protein